MIISDDFVIKCDFCGREYEISPDTLDVDYAYDERGMGTEIQYIFYGETEYSGALKAPVRHLGNQ